MNRIIIRSFAFSMILFAIVIIQFHEYINPGYIIFWGFGFSWLGGLIAMAVCLFRGRAEDRQREEDQLFGITREELVDDV